MGAEVTSIIGFRNQDLVILEDEFKACSDHFTLMTDDGSYGEKGNVTAPLKTLTTKEYDQKTVVSMNPIMVDGTGMCGGCRLTVGGKTKFACVDGPDFDGHEVDFDEAMSRSRSYTSFERHAYEEACNLFKKEVE